MSGLKLSSVPSSINLGNLGRDCFFAPLQQQMDSFYDEFFKRGPSNIKQSKFPKINISETSSNYIIDVAVSGINPDNINVEILENNVLKISGKSSNIKEDAIYHVREISSSSFERLILLPDYIKDDPKAEIKEGILKLIWELPKKEMKPISKRIDISYKKE